MLDHVEVYREIREDAMERNRDVLKRRLQLQFSMIGENSRNTTEQERKQDNW